MIGLMFLLVFGIYLAVSIWIIKATVRWAGKNGRGVKRWGIAAALFMYLLVFWDHIPTLLLHKYYCATKAGFWVYKTPEQWKKENPGVAETLTWMNIPRQYSSPNIVRGFLLNERFVWIYQTKDVPVLPIQINTEAVVDTKTSEIMLKRTSVSAGYSGGMELLRFWTKLESCTPGIKNFGQLLNSYHHIGREVK